MTNIIRFESTGELVFVSDLQPTAESFEVLRSGNHEGELSTILGKITGAKCTVGVAKPICVSLDNCYQMRGLELPKKFSGLSGDFSKFKYFVARFACSFVTIKNCQIEESRFDVQLSGENGSAPIALDLLPNRVVTSSPQRKVTTKIGADLKFLESGVSGEYVSEFEHEKYEPEIYSYGVQTSQFRWKLKRTTQSPIEGDRMFFAIIGKPPHSQVSAQFKVSVIIQTTAFRKIILDTRNDLVANSACVLL